MTSQEKSTLLELLTKLVDDNDVTTIKQKPTSEHMDVLTIPQVAKLLQVGMSKAYEIAAQDNFPVVKIGRCLRVPKESLLEWVNKQQRFNELQGLKSSKKRGG